MEPLRKYINFIIPIQALLAMLACWPSPTASPIQDGTVDAPGYAVGLTDGNATLAERARGVRVHGREDKVSTDDRWAMGSLTKAMTATLAATLVEQRRLKWTDRVKDILPGLANTLPDYDQVTLEQLLTHQAGILNDEEAEKLVLPPFGGDIQHKRLQLSEWLLGQPPGSRPGSSFRYSNGGYLIATAMMEKVMGQPWEQAIHARLLTPLGIRATHGRPGRSGAPQPWGHVKDRGRWVPEDPESPDELQAILAPAGSGLSLTLEEALTWARFNLKGLRGEDTVVLKAETIKKLHDPKEPNGYAMGWIRQVTGGRPIDWHNGSVGTFSSYLLLDPGSDRAIVFFANSDVVNDDGKGTLFRELGGFLLSGHF